MYYPIFRGKQFELLAIRESAPLISKSDFHPIIEPVRETLGGLQKTLQELVDNGARVSVIVNPRHGDHRNDGAKLEEYLDVAHAQHDSISPALLLTDSISLDDALRKVEEFQGKPLTLIHSSFNDNKGLAERLPPGDYTHVFLEALGNTLYRRPFKGTRRILVEDGFKRMRNADYGPVDRFSDLHVTFDELGGDGYGDFLTVGDHYAEGGGPAYAVAIHLTYIDPQQEDQMFVSHFISDTNETPVDPAGKFYQALNKLVAEVSGKSTKIVQTNAVKEFMDLHERGHYPGLGYVKKLSMKHHLETLSNYHNS